MTAFSELYFKSDDGLTLYARDYAAVGTQAKCPIICVHGLTRNSSDFEDIAPWLAQQSRRVIAVDVRGRGKSDYDVNTDNYNPMRYAKDIANLMYQLGIARAVFIGTSMGGITTMTLALQNLKLIVAAVLNDVGPSLSHTGLARIAGYAGKGKSLNNMDEAREYIKEINHYAFPHNSEQEWAKWAQRAFSVNHEGSVVARYDPNIALPLQNGRLKARSFWSKLAFKRLTKNRTCLLIRGGISDLIEAEQLQEMQKLAPRLQYAEVPGVGHAPMLNEPAAKTALQHFLTQCD
ncbi:alpha/beta hydrolase [Undibacterium cyanobacteriorum]|uniref:Alpha/beta hydrolase n=1 Tax=Undibacterium cyanobacteriorum TaxID=3073561 RepID=A0ABY9RGM7_9BURK|nr:alpha/beta hydrolase [Undibacterium sp. 20NA77.5]WMW79824.1 alpha/beta hydrolase [Undibacterium sp. 20NA77.5]